MGKTKYSVEGLNLNYLLERIHKNQIDIYDIDKVSDKKIFFSVKNRDIPKLVALFKDSCYNIVTEKQTGSPKYFKFLLNRMALFIGIAIFLFVSVFYGSAIRSVKYLDDAISYSQTINQILDEENINLGSRNIDTKALSNKILAKVPDFVFVSVYIDGINLNISAVAKDNLSNIKQNVNADVISDFDGVVTKIYVLSGTPLVKAGDSVVKGQTLIKGTIGPEENSSNVLAIGEVFGLVDVVYTEYFETIIDVPFKTGEYYTVNRLTLFNMSFPAKSGEAKQFENFEKEVFTEYLFDGLIFPFKRIREVYYEIKYQQVERNFDKISKIVLGEAEKRALGMLDSNLTVQNSQVTVTDEENRKLITITLSCEKKMSITRFN